MTRRKSTTTSTAAERVFDQLGRAGPGLAAAGDELHRQELARRHWRHGLAKVGTSSSICCIIRKSADFVPLSLMRLFHTVHSLVVGGHLWQILLSKI